jgi:hypothetical protein
VFGPNRCDSINWVGLSLHELRPESSDPFIRVKPINYPLFPKDVVLEPDAR